MVYAAVFGGVFLPLLFGVVTWALVTAYRLFGPDEAEIPLGPDEPVVRAHLAAQGVAVRVGAREIRADVRYRERHERRPAYRYPVGAGMPAAWVADVAARRN